MTCDFPNGFVTVRGDMKCCCCRHRGLMRVGSHGTYSSGSCVENQAYVVAANRSGSDPGGEYSVNSSVIIDHMGRCISTIDTQHGIVYATLDHEALREARRSLPVLEHQDPFTLDATD